MACCTGIGAIKQEGHEHVGQEGQLGQWGAACIVQCRVLSVLLDTGDGESEMTMAESEMDMREQCTGVQARCRCTKGICCEVVRNSAAFGTSCSTPCDTLAWQACC